MILVARRRNRLEEIAGQIQSKTARSVEPFAADLADARDLSRGEALLAERADVDILVNNVGLGALGPISNVTADALDNLIKINSSH